MNPRSNVTNLRITPTRPYDHTTEPTTPVVMSELAWSLVVQALASNPLQAMRDCADEIVAQVRTHQAARSNNEEIRGWDEVGR